MRKAWTQEDYLAEDPKKIAEEALEITVLCGAVLAGHHPGAQGAALAELLVMWINGHRPENRAGLIESHMEAVFARLKLPTDPSPNEPS